MEKAPVLRWEVTGVTTCQSVAISSTVRSARQKHPTGSYTVKGSRGRVNAGGVAREKPLVGDAFTIADFPPGENVAREKPLVVFIVDYDLPQGNKRRNFYRRVNQRLQQMGDTGVTGWSTQSVVITDDPEFAELVYEEAIKIGKAHLYKAEKVK